MERIEGAVARILNARELVLNRGTDHGVEIGMQFAVLNSQGGSITDPETGETLGSIELPKVIVKVVQVYEKLAVASTFRQYKTKAGTFASINMLDALYAPSQTLTETLKTNDRTYREELNSEDSYIHESDKVVQVLGDEFAGWTARG